MCMLAFLSIVTLVARLCSACTCDTNCTDVRDAAHGAWCIEDCGFAVLRNAYDEGFLDDVQKAFDKWYDGPRIVKEFGHRNSRAPWVEVGLPDMHPFNRREVFFNRNVSQIMENYYQLANATLETVTFMHNPSGSGYQSWHMDAIELPYAIKVYVPLVDVSLDMGPIEMSVSTYDSSSTFQMIMEAEESDEATFRKYLDDYGNDGDYEFAKHKGLVRNCTVQGNFERGTIMAYINGAYHRGTPNLSGRNRTVLMYSYMTTRQAELYERDRKMFKPKVQALFQSFKNRYHQYRDEDVELIREEYIAAGLTPPVPQGHLEPFGGWKEGMPIEERDDIPEPREFYDEYSRSADGKGRPVVFRGAARSMSAMQWTDPLLSEKYGSERISGGVEHNLKETRTGGNVDGMDKMTDFLDKYNTTDIYMVSDLPDAMKHDVSFLPCMRCGGFLKFLDTSKLWMGRGDSKSLIHYDDQDNMNCLFSGSKRFVFVHPLYERIFEASANTNENLFGWVDVDLDSTMPGYGGYFRVDVDKMDLIKYRGWSYVDWFYAELKPGDCIYIPAQWYHQVTAAPERSINVHVWYRTPPEFDEESCMKADDYSPAFADCTWGRKSRDGGEKQTECRKPDFAKRLASDEL